MYIPSGTELLNPFQILKTVGIQEGMKFADMGCGTQGHFVFPASHLVGETGVVYAVDILKSALAAVESRTKMAQVNNIETIWSDIEVYRGAKIKDDSLDVVSLINVGSNEAMLKEASRLIKKDGKLLIVDWEKTTAPFGPATKNRPDKERIKNDAKNLKLKFEGEFKAGPYHFGLIFIK